MECKAPDVSHFTKKFERKVLCLRRESGKGKFESRCKEEIFVVYSKQTKVYRIWLNKEKKIEVTRDVKFMESKLSYAREGNCAEFVQDEVNNVF